MYWQGPSWGGGPLLEAYNALVGFFVGRLSSFGALTGSFLGRLSSSDAHWQGPL